MNVNLIEKLSQNKVFPIIRNSNPETVYQTAKAVIEGGFDLIEITVENPKVFSVIKELSSEAIICAGGIITFLQANAAIESGAKLFSSPIYSKNLVKISKDKQIPFIAGTSTANEAYEAWKSRIPLVKVYPVTALGGVEYIENMLRPMPFLNVIAQGDVKLNEVNKYISAGALAVGIGRNLTAHGTYEEIARRTKELKASLK